MSTTKYATLKPAATERFIEQFGRSPRDELELANFIRAMQAGQVQSK